MSQMQLFLGQGPPQTFVLNRIANARYTEVTYSYDQEFAYFALKFRDAEGQTESYYFDRTQGAKLLITETLKIKENERFVGIVYNHKKGRPGIVFDLAFKIMEL